MDGPVQLTAALVRAATSGEPFATDRERAERHVIAALGGRQVTIEWAGSACAATRRALELIRGEDPFRDDAEELRAWERYLRQTRKSGLLHPTTFGAGMAAQRLRGYWLVRRRWSGNEVRSLVPHSGVPVGTPDRIAGGAGGVGDAESTSTVDQLRQVWRIDGALLRRARIDNWSANVSSARRLGGLLSHVGDSVPAVEMLLRDSHASDGRELARAAAAGLFSGYRIDGLPEQGAVTLILVPRPTLRMRAGRLHAAARPAVEWPDGSVAWYWDGALIPRRIAERIGSVTPAEIAAIANAEVRRRVIERVGWERFLGGATLISRDRCGKLWDTGLRLRTEARTVRLVEVVNATVEADGTRRRYCLRVPPTVGTAREAVAWTFGITDARDYTLAAAS